MNTLAGSIGEAVSGIRRTGLFRDLIPQEAGVGWPIPSRKDDRVFVTLPFFGQAMRTPGVTALFPPFATLTLDWATRTPVEYVNLRYKNPWPAGDWETEAGTFPHAAVAKLSRQEYLDRRLALLSLYDELLDKLQRHDAFSEAWTARFTSLLTTLIEPPLEPFYRALGPRFFERFLGANVAP